MKLPRFVLWLSVSAWMAALAGCGGEVSTTGGGCTPSIPSTASVSCPTRTPVGGVSFTGKVLAASQTVSGARVQLYAAGNTGNGSFATALLVNAPTTVSDGSFTIPSGYLCPSAQTPVYLLSKGGQPAPASAPNSALWLMTALGPCGSLNSGSSFVVNEVTTAAAVWALAPFFASGGDLGASCTNTTGLDNAFFTASRLASPAAGTSPGAGLPSTLAVPASKLDTLANALASCTVTAGGNACAPLFTAATSGSAAPTNTLDAALNIARAPGNNAAAIYALTAGNVAFSPALAVAPPDWMLQNTISGGGMSVPTAVSVDASGNVWVASYFNAVSAFSPAGAIFPSGITGSGINESYGMALDVQGNVWIANEQTSPNSGTGNVTELRSSGQPLLTGITSGGIDFPIAVAADPNGNMAFADYGDSKVTLLSPSGQALSSAAGWGGTSLAFPVALVFDSSHNLWVANQAGLVPIAKISSGGSVASYDCDCNGASGVAADQSGNIWIANYYGNSISEVDTCGGLKLDAATGGGVLRPQGIAVDGAGTVWVANYQGNSLSELSASGTFLSPSSGFGTDASLLKPYSLAIDSSGSIWLSNSGANTLTQFIGVAAPVKTPLAGPPQAP